MGWGEQGGGVVARGQPTLSVAGLSCGPDRGEQGCLGSPPPTVATTAPLPQPLSKGRKPKALTQKSLASPPTPIIQSPWRPVALSSSWADRLEGEGKEARERRGRGDMEKSEQGLKNEEINLPGGRRPLSVLHKAVLGPPRTLAGGGGWRCLLLGPRPPLPSWAPASPWRRVQEEGGWVDLRVKRGRSGGGAASGRAGPGTGASYHRGRPTPAHIRHSVSG